MSAEVRGDMGRDLDLLERDVIVARHRVQQDLANLRGPAVDNLKRVLGASAENVFTDIKDRLANNPIATLAIGAGLAWRLVHRPPVASLLVGYGVYSLIVSDPRQPSPMNVYAKQAIESGKELAERATHLAGEAQSAAAEGLHTAQETVAQTVAQSADAIKTTASAWAVQGAATVRERAPQLVQAVQAVQAVQDVAQRDKDTYLLGFAAVALTAAIGIAAQRRIH